MKSKKFTNKQKSTFDPNGNYTGNYIKENEDNSIIVITPPEQDADDL